MKPNTATVLAAAIFAAFVANAVGELDWVQGSTHGYVPPEPHQAFSIEGNGW